MEKIWCEFIHSFFNKFIYFFDFLKQKNLYILNILKNQIFFHYFEVFTVVQAFWQSGQVFFFWFVHLLIQCVWYAWLHEPHETKQLYPSLTYLFWHSRQASFILFLQIAQF
jgi:hypothetical protein